MSSYPSLSGETHIFGYFVNGSTGMGVLLILYTHGVDNDVHYVTAPRSLNTLKVEWTINYLQKSLYNFSAFVLDRSGFPFSRTAIKPRSVSFLSPGNLKGSG